MINYVKGDAVWPNVPGSMIIAHIVNNKGGWGRGFVVNLSKRSRTPEINYRLAYQMKEMYLGVTQFMKIDRSTYVVNMCAQDGYKGSCNPTPLSYDALRICLRKLYDACSIPDVPAKASVHMPYIGVGYGGGKWETIESMIKEILVDNGIEVYVYEFVK